MKLFKCLWLFALCMVAVANCPRVAVADGATPADGTTPAEGATPSEIPVVATQAASQAYLRQSLAAGRCWAVEVAQGDGGDLARGNAETYLSAGRYRMHALLAVAPLGDLRMSQLSLEMEAGGVAQSAGILDFADADQFKEFTVDFSTAGGQCPFSLKWARIGLQAHKNNVKSTNLAAIDPDKENDAEAPVDQAPATAKDGSIAVIDLGKTKFHVAFTGMHIEQLSSVGVKVSTDKMVYKPGDAGSAAVTLHNYSDQAQSTHLVVSLDSGVATSRNLHEETIELAAGASKDIAVPFATADLYWGYSLTAKVSTAGAEPACESDTFAVCADFWETALVDSMHSTNAYADPQAAAAKAQSWRDRGYTVFESGFWPPDDFGDFTPEQDWVSGQNEYRESVAGTKNIIAAAHRLGISSTVYSTLRGGDGPPAFEIMRAHPDWVGSADFGVDWLDMWPMGAAGKVNIGELWPTTNISDDGTQGAIAEHAQQFISSHNQFGWDGTRDDGCLSNQWTKMAIAKVRSIVEKPLPDYRWGYNTNIPMDEKIDALDTMVGNGGLEMEESIRKFARYSAPLSAYANVVATYRDIVWPHGGHLGICYDKPKDQGLDEIYLSSILLAGGAHPYYSQLETEVGNYPRFALRYSEFLWNNKLHPLKNPDAVIQFEGDPHLVEWKRLARTIDLGADKHRLIVHLINAPVDDLTLHNYAYRTSPPLNDFPLSIALPPGAHVTAVFDLCPISEPSQRAVPYDLAGGKLKFKVPQVRFWDAVVIEYTAAAGLE